MKNIRKIGFIGGGNMAEALIRGLLRSAFPAASILVAEPVEARRSHLVQSFGVGTTEDNREAVGASDLVVLAIKPQLTEEVMPGVAAVFSGGKLLVSILAGISTAALERYLDGTPRVVRAMPNTPALIGEGATAVCGGRHAGADEMLTARHLFETVGTVQAVNESQMDAVTGLSGSGPAYVFTVIEALADGGVREGLPRETALALAIQTVLGAAHLARDSGEDPAILRARVCSPGGTTIAAIEVLEEKGLGSALMEAVASAARRSRELGGR